MGKGPANSPSDNQWNTVQECYHSPLGEARRGLTVHTTAAGVSIVCVFVCVYYCSTHYKAVRKVFKDEEADLLLSLSNLFSVTYPIQFYNLFYKTEPNNTVWPFPRR